ncbi:hypothetical protein [Paenibacillus sp. GYB003]|uniref:hypothetical protein n=1 Tax=Paenibacillus sp. GYB003 TaxID=2994392 RepID=UPI002F966550
MKVTIPYGHSELEFDVPDPAVGWSGGGKIIYPGVTGEDTVAKFHIQHGLVKANMFGTDNSPVRLNMEKWVDTVGLHFIINTVMTPDKQLVKVVAGHYSRRKEKGFVTASKCTASRSAKRRR